MFVVIFIGSSSTIIIRIEVYMFHIMGIHMHTYCSRCIPDSMSPSTYPEFLHRIAQIVASSYFKFSKQPSNLIWWYILKPIFTIYRSVYRVTRYSEINLFREPNRIVQAINRHRLVSFVRWNFFYAHLRLC